MKKARLAARAFNHSTRSPGQVRIYFKAIRYKKIKENMQSCALASIDMSKGMYICTVTCIRRERRRHREEKRRKKRRERREGEEKGGGQRKKRRDIFLKKTEKQHRKLAPISQ